MLQVAKAIYRCTRRECPLYAIDQIALPPGQFRLKYHRGYACKSCGRAAAWIGNARKKSDTRGGNG